MDWAKFLMGYQQESAKFSVGCSQRPKAGRGRIREDLERHMGKRDAKDSHVSRQHSVHLSPPDHSN